MGLSAWFGTFLARFMAFLFLLSPGLSAVELAPMPDTAPEPAFTQRAPQELKIMTFNVWIAGEGDLARTNRAPWLAETIRAELPDSVGLQEADEIWRGHLSTELRAQYGFTYLHVNTHLDHLSPLARANGAALVTGFINKLNLPTVLTGDMNCYPSDTPVQYYEAGGLIDTRTVAEIAEGGRTFHGYGGADPATGQPIDYVFANGYLESAASWRVLHKQFDGYYPSDHFAVVAELTLAN